MSPVTGVLILLVFIAYVAVEAVKNFLLRNLNVSLKKKDFETVERLADLPMSRKLLGDYTCDLYKLRGRYVKQDTAAFEELLRQMIATTYKNPEDKKNFLEQYYHTFLLRENATYAQWLLEAIRAEQSDNNNYVRFSQQAYDVMIDHKTDMIDEMIDQVNEKAYRGFALGVVLFMVARQYELLEDYEHALIYYQNAKVCFHPKAVYAKAIEDKLKQLGNVEKGKAQVQAQ